MHRAVVAIALVGCGRVRFDELLDGGIAVDARVAASCINLADTCGPMRDAPCCDSPLVPGGTFSRGYDASGDGMYPDPSYGATVSELRFDKYEVTVGRFRKFVEAGQGTQMNPPAPGSGGHPQSPGTGWDPSWTPSLSLDTTALIADLGCNATFQTWTVAPGANESRPINCITWYEAFAFCAWDGGFMPTDAEYNYVATGGDEQRAYPWSRPPGAVDIDDTRASYWDGMNCMGDGLPSCAVTDQLVVGSKPMGDGRWGQSDLSGNVWEWTLDWYAYPYPQNPCVDCANLIPSNGRSTWSGNFERSASSVRANYRDTGSPDYLSYINGIRCARSP